MTMGDAIASIGSKARGLRRAGGIARAFALAAAGRRVPLIVSWNVTFRCNLDCRYCGVCRPGVGEMDTASAVRLIRSLASLGARFLGLSGGEPLVRSGIERIINSASDQGMAVRVQTNGILVPNRIGALRRASEVQFSLDGPADIHDSIRGKGVYNLAREGIARCLEAGIPALANTVLSAANVKRVDEVVETIGRLGISTYFQPVDTAFSRDREGGGDWFPDSQDFRAAIDRLIYHKENGSRVVRNSVSGLRYFRSWPDLQPLHCAVWRLICSLDPNGDVGVCDMEPGYERRIVRNFSSIREAMKTLPSSCASGGSCPRCATGPGVDFNLAAKGDLGALSGIFFRWLRGLAYEK